MDFLEDIVSGIGDAISGAFESLLDMILYNLIYKALYYLEIGLCVILKWAEELFKVFTGQTMAVYDGRSTYLFDVFFSNNAITGVYMGMAMVGIVIAFVMAIVSVTRKAFDMDDKVKMSMGQILGNLFRSILIIICLNLAVSIVVLGTNKLMETVDFIFDNGEEFTKGPNSIEFTNEQYAAMARIFNTVGNYSINSSYKSRFNLNSCYNEIRPDLKYLADTGVFNFYYETRNKNNKIIPTWQSVLQRLANAADYNQEYPVDVYNEGIANAVTYAMDVLKTDSSLAALEKYERARESYSSNDVGFDRIIFLIGTMGMGNTAAAKNDAYNRKPSMTDAVREPYYRGSKDIYNLDQVNQDFDISVVKTNYLVVYVSAIALGANMLLAIITAVARIFNMLFLYIIAPPVIGVMPLDDGNKFRQWLTAFIIQTFSIFAIVISMRLYLIFIPIVMSPSLELTGNVIIDVIGKLLLIYGGFTAINKANGLLTGILADNAGMQSIMAGDMGSSVMGLASGVSSAVGSAVRTGVGAIRQGAGGFASTASSMAGGIADALRGSSGGDGGGSLPGGGEGSGGSGGGSLPQRSTIGSAIGSSVSGYLTGAQAGLDTGGEGTAGSGNTDGFGGNAAAMNDIPGSARNTGQGAQGVPSSSRGSVSGAQGVPNSGRGSVSGTQDVPNSERSAGGGSQFSDAQYEGVFGTSRNTGVEIPGSGRSADSDTGQNAPGTIPESDRSKVGEAGSQETGSIPESERSVGGISEDYSADTSQTGVNTDSSMSGQSADGSVAGQSANNGITGQSMRSSAVGQSVSSSAAGQPMRSSAAGQSVSSSAMGQTVSGSMAGEAMGSAMPGASTDFAIPGSERTVSGGADSQATGAILGGERTVSGGAGSQATGAIPQSERSVGIGSDGGGSAASDMASTLSGMERKAGRAIDTAIDKGLDTAGDVASLVGTIGAASIGQQMKSQPGAAGGRRHSDEEPEELGELPGSERAVGAASEQSAGASDTINFGTASNDFGGRMGAEPNPVIIPGSTTANSGSSTVGNAANSGIITGGTAVNSGIIAGGTATSSGSSTGGTAANPGDTSKAAPNNSKAAALGGIGTQRDIPITEALAGQDTSDNGRLPENMHDEYDENDMYKNSINDDGEPDTVSEE